MSRTLDGAAYTVDTAYDAQGRIVQESLPGGPPAEYLYDEGGNLSVARPFASALAYNARGQVTAITLDNGTQIATEYEAASGRPLRLYAVGPGGDSLLDDNYGYLDDDLIARIEDRQDPAHPSAQIFTYDARHRLTPAPGQPRAVLLAPMPQIEVRDGLVTLSYFAGGRRIAMIEASGRTLYPITDHLGSTRAVIDGQGRVVARYGYRPFGQRTSLRDDA